MSARGVLRALIALALGVALVGWVTGAYPAVYGLAPLLGLAILRVGYASLRSFQEGPAHIPSGEPTPLDVRDERTTYWCEGCGAELLLLVRGTPMPPRHCGERMVARQEVRGSHARPDDESP
ncbi:MAG: hypothetical protein ACQETV_00310 [Actinomycetota bacterium]